MKRFQGFSMIELLVAMTLGLIVVGGVSAVLISSSTIYRSSDGRAQIQQGARFSLTMMQDDLRNAGYMGCFNVGGMMKTLKESRLKNLADNGATLLGHYAQRVGGFESAGAAWTPALDPLIGSEGGHTPSPGSDVLVVRGPIGASLPLSEPMNNGAEPIPLGSVEGLVEGGLAVVADCNAANIFIVTNIPADKRVLHAASRNTQAQLTRAFSNYQHATVTPLSTVVYFVAPAASGQAGHKGLWRQEGDAAAEEVADGVDQMQIEYGIDTNDDGAPERFVKADAIGTATVAAVKVSMLIKSADNKVLNKAATYVFEGRAPQTATDRRMYTPFSTTISLRNQVN